MSTLVLDVGVAVMFLVVWGLVMVGGYFFGRDDVVEESPRPANSMAEVRPGEPRRPAIPGQPR